MSAEQVEEQSTDVEAEAREMGWVPEDEFRGDKAKWVTAEAFVDHGRQVMPILRKNNERLLEDQRVLRQQVNKLSQELDAARGDFATLEEFHNEEVTRRVAETRKELKNRIKEARTNEDVDAEIEATDQLQQLNVANKAVETSINDASDPNEGAAGPALTPDYLAWKSTHDWFEVDAVRTYEAMAVAASITQDMPHLRGKAFFAEVDRRMLNGAARPATRKVEGSRGGSTQSSNAGRSYADLPSEAKAQCDKYAKKFVRANGQFKSEAEYRKHFVQQLETTGYFE